MKPAEELLARLRFLDRVVQREAKLLESTAGRLFSEPFTLERAKSMEKDDLLSERLDAFAARFSRLQDTLGDKLIPRLLEALGERHATFIDNLDRAERLGWIESADRWMAMRSLRNQMVHEYMEELSLLVSAIHHAQSFLPELLDTARRVHQELQRRSWI